MPSLHAIQCLLSFLAGMVAFPLGGWLLLHYLQWRDQRWLKQYGLELHDDD